ncbi:MAG: carbohydrate kinase family protein [Chloroflexota bacterium]|nr:carbohydrate kinase family protein [Chloroflexota bacterium]
MPPEVIVAGHIALDILPDMASLTPEQVIGPGKVYEIGRISYSTGGAVSNTGLALHQLGVNVGLQAVVGDDWVGRAIIDYVRGFGPRLADHIRTVPDAASPYTVVIEPGNHDRTLLTHTGVYNHYSLADIDLDKVAGCKLFHLGYPTLLPRLFADDGARLRDVLRAVKDMGVITSIDMSLPPPDSPSGRADWRVILGRCLPLIDIFVPSIEEIMFMLRPADLAAWGERLLDSLTANYLEGLADELLALGAGIAGFKLGERGLFLHCAAERSRLAFLSSIGQSTADWADVQTWHPAFQVNVAGTTGAGDAAYAGLLAALIRGLGPEACARFACAVAACNIEAADATTGVRSWEATQARIAAGWTTI